MTHPIKLTGVSISLVSKGTNGIDEYTGFVNYHVQTESIEFNYTYRFDHDPSVAEAVRRGAVWLKQQLEALVMAAGNPGAILSDQ
jgi:hypothetical protein